MHPRLHQRCFFVSSLSSLFIKAGEQWMIICKKGRAGVLFCLFQSFVIRHGDRCRDTRNGIVHIPQYCEHFPVCITADGTCGFKKPYQFILLIVGQNVSVRAGIAVLRSLYLDTGIKILAATLFVLIMKTRWISRVVRANVHLVSIAGIAQSRHSVSICFFLAKQGFEAVKDGF